MNVYFIAIAPQKELSDKIRLISKDFAERFDSVKAFNNFPHITIIPPFKFPEEKEELLLNNFAHIKLDEAAFELALNSFQAFPNKKNPVIYIRPENTEPLKRLYDELNEFFYFTPYKSFHPHVTVAYKDLTYENFEKAWSEYQDKPFHENFIVNTVGIYKHTNNAWKLMRSISLRENL